MSGFEPGSPGVGSDRVVNCAKTTTIVIDVATT